MKESGYYPPGAEFDPNAPYNQKELSPVDTEVCVSYSMSKSMTIPVSNYIEEEIEDVEYEEGYVHKYKETVYNFGDTDFIEEFNNSGELGIPDLLNTLRGIAVDKIIEATVNTNKRELSKWNEIKTACENWVIDELVVTEE